jgi:hypothetical protein
MCRRLKQKGETAFRDTPSPIGEGIHTLRVWKGWKSGL